MEVSPTSWLSIEKLQASLFGNCRRRQNCLFAAVMLPELLTYKESNPRDAELVGSQRKKSWNAR
jgi:hypothetical protein